MLAVSRLSGSLLRLEQKGKVSTQMMITQRGKIARGGDFFEIWCPKTILKYPPKGAIGNLYAV